MVERRPVNISKLDAARRQLRTAATLFFDHGDEVSIHTLAAAGYGLLTDLLHHEGKKTRLEESLEIVIKPEGQALARKTFRRAQNFFKHGDDDPNAFLDFDLREPQFLLFASVEAYHVLTGRHLRELWAFLWWFALEYPHILKPGSFRNDLQAAIENEPDSHHDRRMFFAAFKLQSSALNFLD